MSEGGWPFSTSAHGWPISDCTGEGLKGVMCLLHSTAVKEGLEDCSLKKISDDRLFKAVNILLTYQNEDGGKHKRLQNLNPALTNLSRISHSSHLSFFQAGLHMKIIVGGDGMNMYIHRFKQLRDR